MADNSKEKKKGGGGIVGLVVVTLVALGFGAGFGFFLDAQMKGDAGAVAAPPEPEKPAVQTSAMSPTAKLVTMAPIVANLAGSGDTWIRIEASMLIDGMDVGADALAAQVAEDFVAYLRTAAVAQFEGPSGFQNLRDDFVDRAMIRDREHIKDVIIHGVVLE